MTDAILGTFVKIGTMADGTPRLVLDLQCTLSEVAAMGLIPGVPFAIARLEKGASVAPKPQPEATKEKPGELCIMACNFCDDPMFWRWISAETSCDEIANSAEAKEFVLFVCCIASRKELDTDTKAALAFHNMIRKPFLEWRAANQTDARRAA